MRPDILRLLLLLLLAALPTGCATGSAVEAQAFRRELTVVQLNDIYRVDAVENGRHGGLGRVITHVEALKARGDAPVMVLHAGDALFPSLESQFFGGRQMVEALNHLNGHAPIVFVPGNHEFDEREPAAFVEALRGSRFPWLAGNLTAGTGDPAADRLLGSDTVVVLPSGMRLGIFTLTFLDRPRAYVREDTAYLAAARRQIRRLERAGAHAIVGLTHLDLDRDREIALLRRQHPTFVWIAGGHEHYLLQEPLSDSTALITKGDANARRVWEVELGRSGRRPLVRAVPVTLDSTVPVDPRYAAEVTEVWNRRLAERIPFINAVIGLTDVRLDGSEETVRNQESAWGNFLADRMRTAFPTVPTDLAVLNGGAIRIDDVFSDTIRWEHLARTFGFPTRVGVVWIRGDEVRRMLEHAVSGGRGEGRFLQVSGLTVTFDRGRPEGERVLEVGVAREGGRIEALDDDAVYALAAPEYLIQGGDGYTSGSVAERAIPPGPELRLVVFEALTDALARGEAIAPAVEGRLVEVRAR